MMFEFLCKKCIICETKNSPKEKCCKTCGAPLDFLPAKINKNALYLIFSIIICVFFVNDYFTAHNFFKNKVSIQNNNKNDINSYMADLEYDIKRNWYPPKADNPARVVMSFTIDHKGNLLSSKVKESSGIKKVDEAAMYAILRTNFKPLPKSFKNNTATIDFTFDYKIIKKF